MGFIDDNNIERRKEIFKSFSKQFPNRIPIIISFKKKEKKFYEWVISLFIDIEKNKLKEKKISIEKTNTIYKALNSFIIEGYSNFEYEDGEIVDINENLEKIYHRKKSEDEFLYIKCCI